VGTRATIAAMEARTLPILNLAEARFECTFGRGCDGVCCRNGRPPLYEDEVVNIRANLPTFLPRLRPEARALIEAQGFTSRRGRRDRPLARVVGGWCIFFNHGCVLHRAGVEEGDRFRYKPRFCSLFPLLWDGRYRWYVRQQGYQNEQWNLPCLCPGTDAPPAAESLRDEIALARRITDAEEAGEAVGVRRRVAP